MVILQHGQQQAFTEPAGPNEQQIIARVLQRTEQGLFAVKIIPHVDFFEVAC